MAFIESRGPRRWRARYIDPQGKARNKTFRLKIDAERFLAEIEVAKARGIWVDPARAKTPFDAFARDVLASKINVRGATLVKFESLLRVHIIARFGSTPVNRITRADVQAVVNELATRRAPATVAEVYGILAGIMREAIEEGLIVQSPCRRIKLPRADKTEKRYLSPAELERLVKAFDDEHRPLIYCAAYLGLRWEEIAGLKREHLNLLKRELRVVGTIERVAGSYRYVQETKTATSRRTIQLPQFICELLSAHMRRAVSSAFAFPAPGGGFLRYDNFRRRVWLPGVLRAGLGHLTFHELRHTCVAILIDQGANPLEIQRRLGHANIRTTLGTYGHLFPNREGELNDALEKVHKEALREAAASSARPGVVEVEFGGEGNQPVTSGNDGGRYWDRTSDLFGVNEYQGGFRCFSTSADSCRFPGQTVLSRPPRLPSFFIVSQRRVSNACPSRKQRAAISK